jgi:hypothetical protein
MLGRRYDPRLARAMSNTRMTDTIKHTMRKIKIAALVRRTSCGSMLR